MLKTTAYLGPAYSFCEQAAQQLMGKSQDQLLSCPTIDAVFAAVNTGQVTDGVVPIENACEGSVNRTLDLLAYEYDLKITGEIVIPIQHYLLLKPGVRREDVILILSHPQALAQCQENLKHQVPTATLREASSTAEAACMVAGSSDCWGAVASAEAATAYGLTLIGPPIHDRVGNETRFISIAREERPLRQGGKTSLILHTLHQPGALYRCLQEFSLRGINLSRIESRPAKTKIGQYLFFIDIDGSPEEAEVREAFESLQSVAPELRMLGSYPPHQARLEGQEAAKTLAELRGEIDLLDEQMGKILGQRSRLVQQVARHGKLEFANAILKDMAKEC